MKRSKLIKFFIIFLVLIELGSVFLTIKSYSNKNNGLDEVKLKGNKVSKDMFVIMIEEDGKYVESQSSTWPEDKIYNEEMSGCMDADGKKLEGVLTYNDLINRAYVKVNKEVYCYLYFDAKIEDVELAYTGSYQEYTAETTGYYYIEAYGASGGAYGEGTDERYIPGNGAFTAGYVYLKKNEKLYVYVGGIGEVAPDSATYIDGGYNGGGAANETAGTGGGATDIRYFGDITPAEEELVWDSELGLNSRIMVAAGGGGAGVLDYYTDGGSGGTLIGIDGEDYSSTYPGGGEAGTQISGGAAGGNDGYIAGYTGNFGLGGTAGYNSDHGHGAGAGGAGYYGGGGGSSRNGGGGGGSSFISGYAGVNAITSNTDRTHTNNTLHYSGKYFIDGKMKSGVNEGNGKAKISFFGKTAPERINEGLNKVRYIKDCMNGSSANTSNHWVEFQAIYAGVNVAHNKNVTGDFTPYSDAGGYDVVTDGIVETNSSESYLDDGGANAGNIQCITIDLGAEYDLEEVAVWHYFDDSRVYYDNVTYTSSDNETWTKIIETTEAETSNGKRINAYENISYDVNLTATKSSTGTEIPSNKWSDEGLTFTFTLKENVSEDTQIYYCKDTENSCEPDTLVANNATITDYNELTGTYYIRYKTVNNNGSSIISNYIAKVDTTYPSITYYLTTDKQAMVYCVDDDSGITWQYGEWRKSDSSWEESYNTTSSSRVMLFKIWTAGTHIIHAKCTNGAGITSERYIYLCQSSYQGAISVGACS